MTENKSPMAQNGDEVKPEVEMAEYLDPARDDKNVGGGFMVQADASIQGLKMAKDGKTILLPQPTDSSEDPLNWSWWKKHLVLFTASFGANVSDFTAAAGYAPVLAQSIEWDVSYSTANLINAINTLALGLGGLFWVPMASGWARAPVMFWSTVLGFACALGSCFVRDYAPMFVLRVLLGFFITAAQTVSVGIIKDVFFFHECARKIGIWATIYVTSPYLGPCLGNFVLGATGHWPDVMWLTSGIAGLQLVLIILFLDESWYNRDVPLSHQPPRPADFLARMRRVTGIWSIEYHTDYFPTIKTAFTRFAFLVTRPALGIICVSYMLVFGWAIGINLSAALLFTTPEQFGGYGFSSTSLGYLYFTPIVGIILAEIVGHYLNDWIQRWYIKTHNGIFEPEARLYILYISAPFYVCGLVLTGFALEDHLPHAAVILGWGIYSFGIMLSSVAGTSYVTDAYPGIPSEVAAWINFGRVVGGFAIGFYQEPCKCL
ncbi:hypothetical protein KVR01_006761 [Diaporthe batatas]|uniref:uncharacterized protein n=1 Tax=Diaporthe batatas TaxID=748121 RepID=UPI001D041A8C|nr:uncharacterized protein KVR01_006761 [Diaporthe batatas]KAG8163464.1 hypothetical protein KVR01_006761 [Diaporthe batatas]